MKAFCSTKYKHKHISKCANPLLDGFTLIELLVVVAIISVLISLLLPSLSAAREQARAVICMSQLAEIAKGIRYYADDNNGALVPTSAHAADRPPNLEWPRWFNMIDDYVPRIGKRDIWGIPLMYHCPSSLQYTNNITYTTNREKMYGQLAWYNPPNWLKLDNMDPRTVLIIDSDGSTFMTDPFSGGADITIWVNPSTNEPRVVPWHNGFANYIVPDLHVAKETIKALEENPQLW